MSSLRSRRGGRSSVNSAKRAIRSPRNCSSVTARLSTRLVAAITRTSTGTGPVSHRHDGSFFPRRAAAWPAAEAPARPLHPETACRRPRRGSTQAAASPP